MRKHRVKRYRDFHAYHQLLGAAQVALEDAEEKRDGYYYYQMIAITFSALALESIVNSFGKQVISDWKDFESSSPIAKLRILCVHFNIDADFNKEPWSTVIWLMKFRNQIAHAKPEMVVFDKEMSKKQYENHRYIIPEAKLEKNITLGKAKRAIKSIETIKDTLCDQLSIEELGNLLGDGWHGESYIITD